MSSRAPGTIARAPTLSLRALLLISRPALWVNTLGVAVTGLWLAGELYTLRPGWWLLLLYLTLPYNLLIYGLNDLSDRAEDARNPRKGGWQGARLSGGEDRALLAATLTLNLPFAVLLPLTLPLPVCGVLLLSGLLFAGYSLPPLRFKARPLLDGLSNVAYTLPLLCGPLLLGGPLPLRPLLALALYAVAKHAYDAVQDIPADRAAGVRTLASVLGPRGTALYTLTLFLAAGSLLWPLSQLSALALWLVCGTLSLGLLARPTPAQAARLYPLSVLSPWLVGGVAGVLLVAALVRG